MGKRTSKEEIEEVIGALPLERDIEVLYILQPNSVVVEVGVKGNTSFSDIKKIGEAFGDDDVWIDAVGNEEFKLTIFIL
ncbi:hypothetical protein CUB95_00780 [Prevotella intermedia]|uniref:hypothetical protein n=1 Tax=Prevotella intermedia TaxID=28131 RepID=UPI000C1BD896|nr:hypothetical protein [Prevotella intermedia]ATV37204.1 hypothetical protein CUB95_00780 [Prevotella intermedia]